MYGWALCRSFRAVARDSLGEVLMNGYGSGLDRRRSYQEFLNEIFALLFDFKV